MELHRREPSDALVGNGAVNPGDASSPGREIRSLGRGDCEPNQRISRHQAAACPLHGAIESVREPGSSSGKDVLPGCGDAGTLAGGNNSGGEIGASRTVRTARTEHEQESRTAGWGKRRKHGVSSKLGVGVRVSVSRNCRAPVLPNEPHVREQVRNAAA